MSKYIINFDEIAVSYTRTKAQVVISEDDYLALKNNAIQLEDIIDNYEAHYGEPDEEDFEVEELEIVAIFESEVA